VVPLPGSRKVRALLGYLALSSGPVGRSRLCGLLWDVPNDPRGELRWCVSKLRRALDDETRPRVLKSAPDLLALDLSDCFVDVAVVEELARRGLGQTEDGALLEASSLLGGDLLEALELDGTPELDGWLVAQRQRFRTIRQQVLEELARRSAPDSPDVFVHLERWLQQAPHDPRPHEVLLDALAAHGRVRDGDEHLAATIRAFEQEGVDWAPLREHWRSRRQRASAPRAPSGVPPVEPLAAPAVAVVPPRRRASVAVMPFAEGAAGEHVGAGLTEDVITCLAKLRMFFVIARGTVYSLSARDIGAQEAGRILNADYVVTGHVRRAGHRLSVVVERLLPPGSLDVWDAYHRGLWHMYRFNGPDNHAAQELFRRAIALDPTFARAHAGLSFTHFQNAFLELTRDRARQIELAYEAAAESVGADDRDPAAHWALGRALWLRGAGAESLTELERSIELSPSFALGHYTLGFVHSQSGDPKAAISATDYSRQLSPFDPLQFAMLASRALAHVRLGEQEQAAEWSVRATARPNAHTHILAIAAECLALAGRRDDARGFVARIRANKPDYSVEGFLRAFRFAPDAEKLFRTSAKQVGFD